MSESPDALPPAPLESVRRPRPRPRGHERYPVVIPVGEVSLDGDLAVPPGAQGLVVFAHGSGSSRHSPRNRLVARLLQTCGLGTLLFDLLTRDEERDDAATGRWRFDIERLAERLVGATRWVKAQPIVSDLGVGLFGASTGGAAALVAAAKLGGLVQAVVSRGGRPDLAGSALSRVKAPTLLIVGQRDRPVVELNRVAHEQLACPRHLAIVPGATHLFEESGALEEVARLAGDWFARHLHLNART
jgi:putative phosphoribosyl transferase